MGLDPAKRVYSDINKKLSEAGIAFELKETGGYIDSVDIRKQLMPVIYANVCGNEFYRLLKEAYIPLDKTYQFDDSTCSKKDQNRTYFAFSLQHTISDYHDCEVENAHRQAIKDSLLFCIFVVTIPFVKFFYNHRYNAYSKEHLFKSMFVTSDVLKLKPKGHYHGLLNKLAINSDKPFKEVVFSKKGNIRKFVTASQFGFANPRDNGTFFLGEKRQIEDAKKKFEKVVLDHRRNFRL